ncbi:MAG: methyltransferase [Clostridia bacterium]|nr:methyltransferase [Clostridia bacterium]
MSLYLTDLGRGVNIYQDTDGYGFTQDSVLLANLAAITPKDDVLDLGCGSGVLGFIALTKKHAKSVIGVELQPALADMCKKSVELNDLQDRFQILTGDVKDYKKLLKHGSFSKVLCNPPYFKQTEATDERSIARQEGAASLDDFVKAAGFALKYGGELWTEIKVDRLSSLFGALGANRLEPKLMWLVYPKPSLDVDTVVVKAKKGGKVGLETKTLYVMDDGGNYTDAFNELYR